jgi:hypothetical protein
MADSDGGGQSKLASPRTERDLGHAPKSAANATSNVSMGHPGAEALHTTTAQTGAESVGFGP